MRAGVTSLYQCTMYLIPVENSLPAINSSHIDFVLTLFLYIKTVTVCFGQEHCSTSFTCLLNYQ